MASVKKVDGITAQDPAASEYGEILSYTVGEPKCSTRDPEDCYAPRTVVRFMLQPPTHSAFGVKIEPAVHNGRRGFKITDALE
jgi:hypothetical protein